MTVHLVNPSHLSFGVGVITPRWLFVLAGATPESYGRPLITDETLEAFDRSIDVHISRIRAAIEDDAKKPRRIVTVRGSGYVFARQQD